MLRLIAKNNDRGIKLKMPDTREERYMILKFLAIFSKVCIIHL